ncbi:Na+/citrate or Na+/malate symporter [Cricetibacter osteomyelitidis]|uniref:Na+/citrate or Na+/malate symporter n=1 Tax=Cricetibacter osteomyelitidis TaxID=1521931 RepID=A0A4R2T5S6_9PAST|nr:2-hydroxycarboxylate transporter family protein [Cricetibacter osteomyelitidis]TCP96921.1 Na+/citrate or Na+/malate symporter [Cricetibacter osteomyelitidis]
MDISTSEIKTENIWTKKFYGFPVWFLAVALAIIYISIFFGWLPAENLVSVITVMFAVGLLLYEIGERLPIWNAYIGGGPVMAFFGAAVLEYYNIIPLKYTEQITFFYDDFGFQNLFISLLIVSAVLTVNRKQLIKAFSGYIPTIFGGLILAGVFGLLGAMICGIDVTKIITHYVLPIMGGGNGAGAIPISEMWEASTGQSKEEFYSVAFAILNIANNFAILGAVLLNSLGAKFPKLTGNGELLRNPDKYVTDSEKKEKPSFKLGPYEIAGGLLLTCGLFTLARLFSDVILPNIGSITLHMYAYLVVITAILNLSNIVSDELKQGAKQASAFFTKPLMCMCMCGIGIAFTNLADFLEVLQWQTFVVSAFIVLGAALGAGLVGYMVGFNFVEAAMTAGLCMADRGGSGDLQVLSAGKRLDLMTYAQISSRIGGAIVLLLSSIVFGLIA